METTYSKRSHLHLQKQIRVNLVGVNLGWTQLNIGAWKIPHIREVVRLIPVSQGSADFTPATLSSNFHQNEIKF